MVLQVSLNGEPKELSGPLTVDGLHKELALDPATVAVERNLAIVPRSAYGEVALASGDKLEIVHFIGGGNDPAHVGACSAATSSFVCGRPHPKIAPMIRWHRQSIKSYAENAAALEASGAEDGDGRASPGRC